MDELEREARIAAANGVLACMRMTMFMQWVTLFAFAAVGLAQAAVIAFEVWVCMTILHSIGGP